MTMYFSYSSAQHEVGEVYDARLGQTAKLMLMAWSIAPEKDSLQQHQQQFEQWRTNLRRLAREDDDDDDDEGTAFGHPYEQNLVLQFFRHGDLIWSSDSSLTALGSEKQKNGFRDTQMNGERWRIFQLSSPSDSGYSEWIVVAENHRIRSEIISEIALSTALPQLILLPALLVLLLWLIDKHFHPIEELRTAISHRSVSKLDRINVEHPTLELDPLVDTLNQLLNELEQAWQREKRFTRTAAHELKTPLTILRLNAENALASESPQQLSHDLDNILKGIDRTDRLIHQLLTLAKVDNASELACDSIELDKLLQSVMADMALLALKQQQELSLQSEEVSLQGDKTLLEALFRNLLDNAIRYSGAQSEIDISVVETHQYVDVLVADNGSAIDEASRGKLFEPFFRANSEKGDGAGLGMAICQDIAKLHNATLELLPRSEHRNVFRVRFWRTNP
ncbi:signal transduction histidine kinase [Vibrio vulnificus]|nr:signal transduction histidine kinase [Vibrio vulnificus]